MPTQPGEVQLARVPGGINAESVVAALRGRGIPARLHGEPVGAICGLTLDGLGEVSIYVPEARLDEARAILTAGDQGELLLEDGDSVNGTAGEN